MAHYQIKPGSPDGCYANKVYNNKIFITANNYPGDKRYIRMSWAVYYSAGAGDNDVFGNDIMIEKPVLSSKAIAATFYICGGTKGFGGRFYNYRITTNVPAAWIASFYGGAVNTKIFSNTIIKSPTANAGFKPFRMGSLESEECIAKNVEFRSYDIRVAKFDVQSTEQNHQLFSLPDIKCKSCKCIKSPVKNTEVIIRDKSNAVVLQTKTDEKGKLQT